MELSANGQDGFLQIQFGAIRGVDVNTNSVQCRLQGFLGSRVKHLVADAGRIRVPCNEDELGGGSSVRGLVLEIDQTVAAVVVGKLGAKVFVGLGLFALGFNDNGLFVFNLVNVIAQLFALSKFERVEGSGDFVVDNNTGRLIAIKRVEAVVEEDQDKE